MDLRRTIKELQDEKRRLDSAIETLEQLLDVPDGGPPLSAKSRRGRKSMSEDERRQVSERMARYWASRRAAGMTAASPTDDSGGSSSPSSS